MIGRHAGEQHRATAAGTRGVVACAHQFAADAGLEMLKRGGNAVDAVVAMAATLSVVEPQSTGAGGVGYMTIATPGQARPVVLDFMGIAPLAARPEAFPDPDTMARGARSATVPGAVAGWAAALDRYGRMCLADVLEPAIGHARAGFPVSRSLRETLALIWPNLKPFPTTTKIFMPRGRIPEVGELIRQPDQARTLTLIAESGPEAFYQGPIADEIVRFSQDNGGLLTHEDLAAYRVRWQEPVTTTYRDFEIWVPPPPCSAVQYLIALNMLEHTDLAAMDHRRPDYVHLLAETFKLAIADRIEYTARPDAPWETLLSSAYAARRLEFIDPDHAALVKGERYSAAARSGAVVPGSATDQARESTTHLAAMDAEGYLVSCTSTIGGGPVKGFGSGAVFGSTGLPFNNKLYWFDLDPASPNVVGPGTRGEAALAPSQIWCNGQPFAALGTPGSWGILQTTPQLLINLIDHQMSIQAAIEAPRFRIYEGRTLAIETRVPDTTIDDMRALGHEIRPIGRWSRAVGGAHGVMRDNTATLFGGADPRRDGIALAY